VKVRVRLFAVARQTAGCDSIDLCLSEGATVGDLRSELARRLPQLARFMPQMMFAIGTQYADDRTPLAADTDIACIPPVSGG
jgi:molybdopterin converting factor small subunit